MKRKNFMKQLSESESESIEEEESDDQDDYSITAASNDNLKRKHLESEEENSSDEEPKIKKASSATTIEELKRLEETENMYHSNMFRMQIEELLKEVKTTSNVETFVNEWLLSFNKFLKSLKKGPEKTFVEVVKSDVAYPLITKVQDLTKAVFQFFPPEREAKLTGSQRYGTNIGDSLNVDIVVTIPFNVFHKEDYLNERYFHKKAFYLQTLAENLIDKDFVKDMKFNYFKNDTLRPVLEISANCSLQPIVFVIHCFGEEKTFKLHRFLPSTNNVRSYFALCEEEILTPTPNYNSSILYDLTFERNQDFVDDMIENNQSIRDAIVLLKIWAKQRHFDEGYYPFNSRLITLYICYLIKTETIFAAMSSYQIIRLFWFNLSKTEWNTKGPMLCPLVGDQNRPSLVDFNQHFDVVFVDFTGYLNFCANMSLDLYKRVKEEAVKAINCLDSKTVDSFQSLFMKKLPPYLQYDQILTIKNYNIIMKTIDDHGKLKDKLNFCDNWYALLRKIVMPILKKALKNRVNFLVPISHASQCWPISQPHYFRAFFSVGLILNPLEALTIVEKGPQANDPESKNFRQFWGDKSELRRFKDGSITESCVWAKMEDPVGEKRLICKRICYHILKRHFNIPEISLHFLSDQFDIAIRTKGSKNNDTGEHRALSVIQVFDKLSQEMRTIDSIPLAVTSVLGIDPVFRYCDLETPFPKGKTFEFGNVNGLMASKSIKAVFQLSSSGKWPDNINALRKLKTAFCLQIAKALRLNSLKTVVQVQEDCMYVLREGYVFKMILVHPKEVHLLRETMAKNKVTKVYKDNEQSIQIEKQGLMLPKLTSSLHGLHSQYSSFGPAVNIAKRWLFSQLIDSFLFPEECTELILANLYLNQNQYETPVQPQTGFFRFLNYMAFTDFVTEMLVVNFHGTLEEEEMKLLDKRFTTDRVSLPPLCIVTSCDYKKYSVWSKKAPCKEILRLVQNLAKNALHMIEHDLLILSSKKLKTLFTPNTNGYNVLIHVLESVLVPSYTIPVNRFSSPNLDFTEKKLQAVDFNAAQLYLTELRKKYDDYALFFYDPCEGTNICVLWKPFAFERSKGETKAIKQKRVKLDIDSIIQSFETIGKGFVTKVEILSDKLQ
ncbi:nucleolar protein 6 [Culicoides brevitarsis]|uniref:nucleolar protein 6 n=1 Tax=Culicoides brevitarsis TaxID=469753 RepID=UPI00307C1EDA